MNPAVWAAIGAAAAVLLVALATGLAMVLVRRVEAGRRAAHESAAADVEALRAQVEDLSEELRQARSTAPVVLPSAEFVITSAGDASQPVAHRQRPQVPEGAVLSVTLGEPLVKLVAWGHGVRKALSAENRNRIAFEMRREVKRSRKVRRRAARRARVAPAHREESAA